MTYLEIALNVMASRPLRDEPSERNSESPGDISPMEEAKSRYLLNRMAESERQFGHRHSRLFPLIGMSVWTPQGPGKLLCVFATQCEVLPDGNGKSIRVRTEDVRLIH